MNNKTKLELLKKEINELYDKMQKSNIENYYNNNDAMNRNNLEHKKILTKNHFSKTYDNLYENNIINNY